MVSRKIQIKKDKSHTSVQICDGVGTLVNAGTMEALDWNMEEESLEYLDNNIIRQQQELTSLEDIPSREIIAHNTQDSQVQPFSSMLTMETIRPEKKKYYSLQIFKFGSISISSSCSSLDDSVPLLDDEDSM